MIQQIIYKNANIQTIDVFYNKYRKVKFLSVFFKWVSITYMYAKCMVFAKNEFQMSVQVPKYPVFPL